MKRFFEVLSFFHAVPAALLVATFAASAQQTVLYVPGMTNISGLAGTHFSSDLKLANRGSATALVSFEDNLGAARGSHHRRGLGNHRGRRGERGILPRLQPARNGWPQF